jgi:hypothetical protein
MDNRRFPPPWTIEELNNVCFVVKDRNDFSPKWWVLFPAYFTPLLSTVCQRHDGARTLPCLIFILLIVIWIFGRYQREEWPRRWRDDRDRENIARLGAHEHNRALSHDASIGTDDGAKSSPVCATDRAQQKLAYFYFEEEPEEDRRAQASQQRSGGTFEQFIGVKCQLKSDHL